MKMFTDWTARTIVILYQPFSLSVATLHSFSSLHQPPTETHAAPSWRRATTAGSHAAVPPESAVPSGAAATVTAAEASGALRGTGTAMKAAIDERSCLETPPTTGGVVMASVETPEVSQSQSRKPPMLWPHVWLLATGLNCENSDAGSK